MNKIFQMSLKYLSIMEVLKTLSVDEVEKIGKMTSERAKKAEEWFHRQVNELTQIPLTGRDWEVLLPKSDDEFIYVCWTTNHRYDEKEHIVRLLMKFNDTDIKILGKIYQICKTCRALYKPLYFCDDCKFVGEIPVMCITLNDLIQTFNNPTSHG